MTPQWTFALALAGLHTVTFGLCWAAYGFMHRKGLFPAHRVASGAAPEPPLLRHASRELLVGQPVFALLCAFLVYPLWTLRGGSLEAGWPVWHLAVLHFLAFVFANDTIFYFSHRLLHTRWLYKRVHGRHHRFRFVRSPSAEFAHPVENAANFVAFFAGPVVLGSPFPLVALWVVIRVFETVDAHSGYELTPWASRHAFHHMYAARGCYGSFAGLWDRLLGTERAWRTWRAQGAPVPKSAAPTV